MAIEPMTFSCPACGIQLAVPARLAGIQGPCPACRAIIQSPLPDIPPVTPTVAVTQPVLGTAGAPLADVNQTPVGDTHATPSWLESGLCALPGELSPVDDTAPEQALPTGIGNMWNAPPSAPHPTTPRKGRGWFWLLWLVVILAVAGACVFCALTEMASNFR